MSWAWKIQKSKIGYQVLKGKEHKGGELSPTGIGYTMPAFITSSMNTFDTYKQAKSYIKKNMKPDDYIIDLK